MKTKKLFFLISITFFTIVTNAQLQVRSNGSMWQGYEGYPCMFLGNYPSGGYNNGEWAMEVWNGDLNIYKPWPSQNSADYYLFISKNGNVGIGKVPSAKLDVNGSIAIYGTVKLSSDERLKTNIAQFSQTETNKLYQLNAKSYQKHQPEEVAVVAQKDKDGNINPAKNFIKNKKKQEGTTEYGFLAQELKEIYPDLVSQDSAGYYLVDYIGLIPVLVEAIKEQKIVIDQLSSKINGSGSSGPKKIGATTSTTENSTDLLNTPVLDQNIPNPFNTATSINYYLPSTVSTASIYIYDMNGTQLNSYSISQRGKGSITIQGSEFSAGMYLYALITDGKVIDTKRMILTK